MITAPLLAHIMQCPPVRAERWNTALAAAMREFGINSKRRAAHFYAQTGHESLSLSKIEEGLNYSQPRLLEVFGQRITPAEAPKYTRNPQALANFVYANREGNGNVASGDGWRYRGRGPIQISLKNQYIAIGKMLDLPLAEQPDLLFEITTGARAAAAYWKLNGLNALADANDTVGLSKKINLGNARSKRTPEGLSDRITRTNRALALLAA
ncbi:glycoside hydrolase family 19 protein [Pseudoxanthomonas wuyuanensis]|uniref:Putative chitinase n=1 Tax=Pseudoxanthomonas wuyuanensis TaxID=1073196 RepID=A0A286D4W1_9GAMM|nr:glycoside hydrolase family 19 protein [Pseudoxanthomonas wuyuanensis]KAF1719808.1 lysozyme [Pseudoxanthomonas wuyuanensis]SOD53683.1 putative chitinase [Pseudoxanthomonas wuyuanensis]